MSGIHSQTATESHAHPPFWWRASRCLSLLVVVAVLVGVGGAWIAGHESLFCNGPLAPYHVNLEGGCTACHSTPFSHVQDAACMECHEATIPSLKAGQADHPAFLTQAARWEGRPMSRCGICHLEHRGDVPAVDMDERLCTRCHTLLPEASGRNVFGFSTEKGVHPQIRMHRDNSPDPGQLKFSHARHSLVELTEGSGEKRQTRSLGCLDCHVPDGEGKAMLPIDYEQHCATCHPLRLPRAKGEGILIPHGKPDQIRAFLLQTYYEEPGGLSEADLRAAVNSDEAQLYFTGGRSKCERCHFTKAGIPTSDGSPTLPGIIPPEITSRWFLFSVFSHKAHIRQDCKECHFVIEHKGGEHVYGKGVEESPSAEDVLIPPLEVCTKCHQPGKARNNCTLCHTFHPTREEWAVRAGK